ncbi:MAG: flagellar type III secretion system pore protein FliP [Clostridiales bacterium]|nr:flagellar type III secretion system pore protein FliP [Clostridiales bacterium]
MSKADERRKIAKKKLKKTAKLLLVSFLMIVVCAAFLSFAAFAEGDTLVNINGDSVDTLEIIETLTLIALIPSILIMTTCFTRIIIVLSFVRNGMGLQSTPPNQVLIGIALFLTLFIMSPIVSTINTEAYEPYKAEQISREEFIQKATEPLKEFMLKNTKKDDLMTFANLANTTDTKPEDMPITTIIPAFMTSELKRAFTIGFLIYIPFLIIDMIVSSTLMSMGMIMLPPATIAMPFKLLLFVLVDGWGLLFKALASSFNL